MVEIFMLSDFKRGIISGLVATTPMSLYTYFLFRKYQPSSKKDLVLAVHFGYGILTALAYTACAKKFKFNSPLAEGASFGLSTWAASYSGLTPLFSLHEKTLQMIARRKKSMTIAHILWGICLGFVEHNFRNHERNET